MIAFVDEHPGYDGAGHIVTNENTRTWRELIAEAQANTIGTIASGGEVVISVFLPRTCEKVVAVDHSYRALAATCLKLLMLDAVGPTEMRELMISNNPTKLREVAAPLVERMPSTLANSMQKHAMLDQTGYYNSIFGYASELVTPWKNINIPTLGAARRHIDKLVLVHGDLRDLDKHGPFDMLYISNAMEHTPRDRKMLTIDQAATALKPGGFLLRAAPIGTMTRDVPPWKVLGEKTAIGSMNWKHLLYQRSPVSGV